MMELIQCEKCKGQFKKGRTVKMFEWWRSFWLIEGRMELCNKCSKSFAEFVHRWRKPQSITPTIEDTPPEKPKKGTDDIIFK